MIKPAQDLTCNSDLQPVTRDSGHTTVCVQFRNRVRLSHCCVFC